MAFLSKQSKRATRSGAPRGWRKNHLRETTVRRHERDFAFQREAAQSPREEREPSKRRRNIILSVTTALLLGTAGGLMLFHPAFGIEVITINGLHRTSYSEVRKTAELLMGSPRWGFVPRRNYFLLNASELSSVIKDRFSLESVVVERIFPHALVITAQEREPILVVAEHAQVSVVDQNGEVVEKIGRLPGQPESTSTMPIFTSDLNSVRSIVQASGPEIKNLPILLFDKEAKISTSTPDAKADVLAGVLAWNLFLRDQNVPVTGYTLEGAGSGEVIVQNQPKLLVNFVSDRDKQFLGLSTFLKEKKGTDAPKEYIDLRYPGKVFWK